ncbi:MFS transporter [Dactylosporangium vinaceum]|uniref:MFS transporter n=1 Tax=Dactylosporangium vinaceum TaxID=53362 RepID=A0ABV5M4Y9_9ACTN|nr:MFS transporter [Dactylosporangium vinaceum]UAB96015.1 MFS transporter [Dactylosporangium vinaceum]
MNHPSQSLPGRVRAGYALGSLVTGAFGTVPGLLLLPYLTDTLGVAAGIAGLLVLAPKAWDVLINPVAGRISDRTRTRWGARRPFLLGAGLAVALLFAAIFAAPIKSGVYVALTFLATATAYAFYQVPYVAMPAEMTDDYTERTRLMTWRVAILAVAILVSGALAPVVTKQFGDGVPGHRAMGVFVAVLILIGTAGSFFGTSRAPTGRVLESEASLKTQLRTAGRNKAFTRLLVCFIIQAAGIATMLAGVSYFATQVLRDPDTGSTVLFACFVGPALLVMPLWSRVGAKIGKLRSYFLSSLVFAGAAALMALAPVLPAAAVYVLTGVVGCGYAGQQVFGLAMLPDCIAYDAARTGRRQAGVFTGLWTAGETFGLALGPGIFALLLAAFGYVSSDSGTAAAQTDTARLGVLLGFTVVPAIVVALALFTLRGYDLDEERLSSRSEGQGEALERTA